MSLLSKITTGRVDKPLRTVLYGVDGVGKTTFAAGAPKPLFIGAEDGTAQLDVARFAPGSWAELKSLVETLATEAHEYKTLVLDSIDWAEPLCLADVCARGGKKSIEDFGFGKGYVQAVGEWRGLLETIDVLREKRGMGVVLIGHAKIKSKTEPDLETSYDRYQLKAHEKTADLIREWADLVAFANYEKIVRKTDDGKARATSSGARIMHTEYSAAFDAKNRLGLPPRLPLSYADLQDAIKSGAPGKIEEMKLEFIQTLELVDAATRAKASAWFEDARNTSNAMKLAQGLDNLKAKARIAA